MKILMKRTEIPRVVEQSRDDYRLVILPGEDKEKTTNIGRPIGPEYWNVDEKIRSYQLFSSSMVFGSALFSLGS